MEAPVSALRSPRFVRTRLSFQFSLVLLAVTGGVILLLSSLHLYLHMPSTGEYVRLTLNERTRASAARLAAVIARDDFPAYQTMLFALVADRDVTAVTVREASDSRQATTGYARGMIRTRDGDIYDYWDTGAGAPIAPGAYHTAEADLVHEGTYLGRMSVRYTREPLVREIISYYRSVIILVLAAGAVLVVAIMLGFRRLISGPLARLAAVMSDVALGNLDARADTVRNDEIGRLARGLNFMILKLRKSLDSKAERNRQLEDAVAFRTRELVRAEKMASLGELVAGVSHEINTPVGIGITAVSHQQQITEALRRAFDAGTLTRADFTAYLDDARESLDMIHLNLARAAELVQSFKQVAADRGTWEHRRIALKEYLAEVLVSLRPRFRNTPYTVSLHAEEEISLETYPGAISQIITNLVVNSLVHGFEGRDRGSVYIEVVEIGSHAVLTYSDDGVGIAPDLIDRIYDPFFTTRRNRGGTGLGLNIVYNLVTQTLGGTIHCYSAPGKGTSFIIRIPGVALIATD